MLRKVFEQEGKILIFADFAGRIAPLLSDLNQGRNLTLILDHHVAEASTDARVHNLDPDLFGLKGDRDISASTTCYLFAWTLDPVNRDLATHRGRGRRGGRLLCGGPTGQREPGSGPGSAAARQDGDPAARTTGRSTC